MAAATRGNGNEATKREIALHQCICGDSCSHGTKAGEHEFAFVPQFIVCVYVCDSKNCMGLLQAYMLAFVLVTFATCVVVAIVIVVVTAAVFLAVAVASS